MDWTDMPGGAPGGDAQDGDAQGGRLAGAEARVRALHRELVEAGHEMEALRHRTREAEARERQSSEQLTELIGRLHVAEAMAAQAERLQARAEGAEAAARAQADAAQALLAATRASWSWRLAAPVRVLGGCARLIRRPGGERADGERAAEPS